MTPVPSLAGRSRTMPAPKRPVTSKGMVPLVDRHGHQRLLRLLDALADGLGNFLRLAEAEADVACAVADHDQGAEAEPPTALHDLGDAVDVTTFSLSSSPCGSMRSQSLPAPLDSFALAASAGDAFNRFRTADPLRAQPRRRCARVRGRGSRCDRRRPPRCPRRAPGLRPARPTSRAASLLPDLLPSLARSSGDSVDADARVRPVSSEITCA